MPKKSDNNIHINDGDAMLYRRERSNNWYLRYKEGVRGWRRVSMETDDEDKARKNSKEIIADAMARDRLGLISAPSTNFRSVAQLVCDDLLKISNGKNNEYHKLLAIRKYLIPFFGNKSLNKIINKDFESYLAFVTKQLGKKPSLTMLRKHNKALKDIYEFAIGSHKLKNDDMPSQFVIMKKQKVGRRGGFTSDEYEFIEKFIRTIWALQARSGNEKNKRELLRDYIVFLANSGIRSGTETANIKWRHIEWKQTKKGNLILWIYIENSKSTNAEGRYVAVRTRGKEQGVARALEKIISRNEKYKDMTLDEVLNKKIDDYVFRDKNDNYFITNIGRMFATVLNKVEMKYDNTTNNERTLYSLRHFYVTQELMRGELTHFQIAQNCGTSVTMLTKYYADDTRGDVLDAFGGYYD